MRLAMSFNSREAGLCVTRTLLTPISFMMRIWRSTAS